MFLNVFTSNFSWVNEVFRLEFSPIRLMMYLTFWMKNYRHNYLFSELCFKQMKTRTRSTFFCIIRFSIVRNFSRKALIRESKIKIVLFFISKFPWQTFFILNPFYTFIFKKNGKNNSFSFVFLFQNTFFSWNFFPPKLNSSSLCFKKLRLVYFSVGWSGTGIFAHIRTGISNVVNINYCDLSNIY